MSKRLKIAVASSGLGHISRGVETWTEELGTALRRAGHNAYIFQGAGRAGEEWRSALPCLRRFAPETQRVVNVLKHCGGWHYGFGSGYDSEQTTFTVSLWRRVFRDFDILHVKDPGIALWMDRLNRLGLSRPRVIISHGTEEEICTLQRYSYLQHMAPAHLEAYRPYSPPRQLNFMVPNFVNTTKFSRGDRITARRQWGLPADGLVFLCVSAIRRFHKRIDYLIEEFTAFLRGSNQPVTLVIAGAREAETDELLSLGRSLGGDKIKFLEAVPRDKVPSLYHAADAFVLTSLYEMFGNVFLEAMACGLPIICNETQVTKWVVGRAGLFIDLSRSGRLADAFQKMAVPSEREKLSLHARPYVEQHFSETAVLDQILEMYRQVLIAPR
jgi:glycosyltransferase involved in cell wall biosynthesis